MDSQAPSRMSRPRKGEKKASRKRVVGKGLPRHAETVKGGSRKSMFTCFNLILALILVEAISLILVGFFSDFVNVPDWGSAPMDYLMLGDMLNIGLDDQDDDLLELEDSLAAKTEERLREGLIVNITESLDDFYQRPHIRPSPENRLPLVVGGSDGSGTRAFVDILARLGVPMLVDDSGTMDLHAEKIGGWPPLVTSILEHTHTANYKFGDLPTDVQKSLVDSLEALRVANVMRVDRLLAKPSKRAKIAKGVSFGFKAPVSMLLLPALREVFGSMRFLHVVRDGRDVSLSKNQSPVKKFYDLFFEDAELRKTLLKQEAAKSGDDTDPGNVMAMQLWNDWNTQVYEWERHHADGENFDFHIMRTEDLLDPEKKFESLVQLAEFVGSPKTMEELCCMSRRPLVDMGQSGTGGRKMGMFPIGLGNRMASFNRLMGKDGSDTETMRKIRTLRRRGGGLTKGHEENNEEYRQLKAARIASLQAGREDRMAAFARLRDKRFRDIGNRIAERVQDNGENRLQKIEMLKEKARIPLLLQGHIGAEHDIVGDTEGRRRLGEVGFPLGVKHLDAGAFGAKKLLPKKFHGASPVAHQFLMDFQSWRDEFKGAMLGGEDIDETLKEGKALLERYQTLKDDLKGIFSEKAILAPLNRVESMRKGRGGGGGIMNRGGGDDGGGGGGAGDGSNQDVKQRYGKWVKQLHNKPTLAAQLHMEGAEGLATFGYDPEARFLDFDRGTREFQCDSTVVCEE